MKTNEVWVGLMSGTSLDGLDIVAVRFSPKGRSQLEVEWIAAETISYSEEWWNLLGHVYAADARLLTQTHWRYGRWLGEQVREFVAKHDIEGVAGVGSHGHTIFHDPDQGYTLQIGEGHALHEACGFPVVADFRSANVAKGGQGAPLVPYGDGVLFGEYSACINLGGYANISFTEDGVRKAFDIAACNVVFNTLARKLLFDFDENGDLAKSGKIIPEWLHQLNDLPYYKERGPKSLSKEWLDQNLSDFLSSSQLPQDLMATYVRHLALQLTATLSPLVGEGNGQVLVTGGGSYHRFLIRETQFMLPQGLSLTVPDNLLVEYKEALIFALLARQYSNQQTNCLASATGCPDDHIVGVGYGLKTR